MSSIKLHLKGVCRSKYWGCVRLRVNLYWGRVYLGRYQANSSQEKMLQTSNRFAKCRINNKRRATKIDSPFESYLTREFKHLENILTEIWLELWPLTVFLVLTPFERIWKITTAPRMKLETPHPPAKSFDKSLLNWFHLVCLHGAVAFYLVCLPSLLSRVSLFRFCLVISLF